MNEDNEYQEISQDLVEQGMQDEQQEYGDNVREVSEDQSYGSMSEPKRQESLFSLFREIIQRIDSTKVANLDKRELGMLDLSVRNSQHLANLGTLLHNKSFHDFFMNKGEIILGTSMSKRGWLTELIVSQKKFNLRAVQPVVQQQQKRGGFLGLGKKQPPQQQ